MVTPDRCTEEARGRVLAEDLKALERDVDRALLRHDWGAPGGCHVDVTLVPPDWWEYLVLVGEGMGWTVCQQVRGCGEYVSLVFRKPEVTPAA